MTVKTYNVAKVDTSGIEIIQIHPPLSMREAREVRVRMQRTFKMNRYVVVNIGTILDQEG